MSECVCVRVHACVCVCTCARVHVYMCVLCAAGHRDSESVSYGITEKDVTILKSKHTATFEHASRIRAERDAPLYIYIYYHTDA